MTLSKTNVKLWPCPKQMPYADQIAKFNSTPAHIFFLSDHLISSMVFMFESALVRVTCSVYRVWFVSNVLAVILTDTQV